MKALTIKYLLFIALISLLFSCGTSTDLGGNDLGNTDVNCPPGSKVTFITTDPSITDPSPTLHITYHTLRIFVADDQNRPIRSAHLEISSGLASPNQFDNSVCGIGVSPLFWFVDGNNFVNSQPFIVNTGDYGYYDLVLALYSGGTSDCGGAEIAYTADINAVCGAASDKATLTVN